MFIMVRKLNIIAYLHYGLKFYFIALTSRVSYNQAEFAFTIVIHGGVVVNDLHLHMLEVIAHGIVLTKIGDDVD